MAEGIDEDEAVRRLRSAVADLEKGLDALIVEQVSLRSFCLALEEQAKRSCQDAKDQGRESTNVLRFPER